MSTAVGHGHPYRVRHRARELRSRQHSRVWLGISCALGFVLLTQMAGALTSRWTLAAVVTVGILLGVGALLVASPVGPSRAMDVAALYSMSPVAFERHVAARFAAAGYTVRHVGGSGDGGVDVRVWRDGWTGVVQCKRYRADRTLGPAAVRELVGTRAHERAHVAWLATTAPLSAAARRLAEEEGIVILDADALAGSAQQPWRWRRSRRLGGV